MSTWEALLWLAVWLVATFSVVEVLERAAARRQVRRGFPADRHNRGDRR